MAVNFLLADMLTRIRNAQKARLPVMTCPASKLLGNVLEVLKKEGFIREFSKVETSPGISNYEIELKYYEGEAAITQVDCVSKPGRRVYSPITELAKHHNGLGITILSTSKGVLSDFDARQANVGGEVLCTVF